MNHSTLRKGMLHTFFPCNRQAQRSMEWRRLLLALFVSVSQASHEWSSGDEARSAAQAARLEIGARSLAESFSHHATLLRRHVLDGSLGLSPAGLPCLLANRNSEL